MIQLGSLQEVIHQWKVTHMLRETNGEMDLLSKEKVDRREVLVQFFGTTE